MRKIQHQLQKLILLLIAFPFVTANAQVDTVRKKNIVYDFTFADLAIKYIEEGDTTVLHKIACCSAATHLLNHHLFCSHPPKYTSTYQLVADLLNPRSEYLKVLPLIKRNLQYARDSIAAADFAQNYASRYLNNLQPFNATLYFTVGYDLGVAVYNGSSLNIAHPHYLSNIRELKYYSIHELHHAGFIISKQLNMPSLKATTHRDMAAVIEYLTHLEGMGTYAALEIRKKENAMNDDSDYRLLQDGATMKTFEKEYFEIYRYFKSTPNQPVTNEDWGKLNILSDKRRLWYRVGAHMAQIIDSTKGRKTLTLLIAKPSANFISTYLRLKPFGANN